jgi:hypothetical protein
MSKKHNNGTNIEQYFLSANFFCLRQLNVNSSWPFGQIKHSFYCKNHKQIRIYTCFAPMTRIFIKMSRDITAMSRDIITMRFPIIAVAYTD